MLTAASQSRPAPYTTRKRYSQMPVCLSATEKQILIGMLTDRRAFSALPEQMPNAHPEIRIAAYSLRITAAKSNCVQIDVAAWFGRVTKRREKEIFAAVDRLEALGLVRRLAMDRPGSNCRANVEGYRGLTPFGTEHAMAELAFQEFREQEARAKSGRSLPPPRKLKA